LNSDQKYTITVTTPEGCTASDTMLVKVFAGTIIYVPSAFTPNGDGKNELLLPVYVGIKELKRFAVFNRWGQLVFQTDNMTKGWNGKAPAATYVWVVEAMSYLGQPIVLKGTVTIIR
ncbi:MAG TPA: gliding motility-associated C-terminal domain-containing protein, partial [Flavisolibacter sp.]